MKRSLCTVAILLSSTLSMSALGNPSEGESSKELQAVFDSLADRYSYAYGADLADRFKAEGIELDLDLFALGMRDAIADERSRMSVDEVAETLRVYHDLHFQRKKEIRAAQGEVNKKAGAAFLAENMQREGVTVTASGLQYRIIEEGEGGYTPKESDVVNVHYRATFVDGSEFDSTYERNEAFSSRVARLIPGWSEAIQLMTKGARWEVYIPSELAYGEDGSGSFVGPHAVLIFEVELIDIEKQDG